MLDENDLLALFMGLPSEEGKENSDHFCPFHTSVYCTATRDDMAGMQPRAQKRHRSNASPITIDELPETMRAQASSIPDNAIASIPGGGYEARVINKALNRLVVVGSFKHRDVAEAAWTYAKKHKEDRFRFHTNAVRKAFEQAAHA